MQEPVRLQHRLRSLRNQTPAGRSPSATTRFASLYNSGIRDMGGRVDFDLRPQQQALRPIWRKCDAVTALILPGATQMISGRFGDEFSFRHDFGLARLVFTTEAFLYAEDEVELADGLTANVGLHGFCPGGCRGGELRLSAAPTGSLTTNGSPNGMRHSRLPMPSHDPVCEPAGERGADARPPTCGCPPPHASGLSRAGRWLWAGRKTAWGLGGQLRGVLQGSMDGLLELQGRSQLWSRCIPDQGETTWEDAVTQGEGSAATARRVLVQKEARAAPQDGWAIR